MTSSSKRSDKAPKPVTASSKTMPAKRTSFLSGLAVFGDSIWALILSFCLLVVAVGVALYLDTETTAKDPADVAYAKLPPTPKIGPAKVYEVDITNNIDQLFVTKQMRLAFEQDGVIAVRGLLTDEEMDMLEQASNQIVLGERQEQDKNRSNRGRSERQFHTVVQGAIFMEKEDTPNASMTGFRQVALFSNIPQVAAELLNLKNKEGTSNASNETMRLLRDIFLAKDSDQFICGWHVDDTGFWPAVADAPGVNAWIAIDDMPTRGGGGFALAVGSHKASWRQEAHEAIGSPMTFPKNGFKDAQDLFESRVGEGTCNMKRAAPHLNRRMEETKRIYEVRRGDVIFTDRWIFHRTVPFNRRTLEERNKAGDPELIFRRYSLRYNAGSARIPKGYGTELSVLWDEANGGRTGDEVAAKDGPWYPRCFPEASQEEMKQLNSLIRDKLPVAQERVKARKEEMKPFLKELGKKQQAQARQGSTNGY